MTWTLFLNIFLLVREFVYCLYVSEVNKTLQCANIQQIFYATECVTGQLPFNRWLYSGFHLLRSFCSRLHAGEAILARTLADWLLSLLAMIVC